MWIVTRLKSNILQGDLQRRRRFVDHWFNGDSTNLEKCLNQYSTKREIDSEQIDNKDVLHVSL